MSPVPEGAVVGSLTLAALWSATPFGIPVETIALGTLFVYGGVIGRGAFELQKIAEGNGGMRWSQICGWMGAGFLGGPFMSLVTILFLKLIGAQVDNLTVIGFSAMGFFGPRALNKVIEFGSGLLRRRYGSLISPSTGDENGNHK